jgi:hypothetical protein
MHGVEATFFNLAGNFLGLIEQLISFFDQVCESRRLI